MPKVSIVVPVYNTSAFLRQCLDSLVSQTLQDIEIICVNDGSTDSSFDIINEYAKRDDRVKVISQINKGYGAAMNSGFAHASGEYIGIVESDDYADPEMFEELYVFAKDNNADVVKSDYYTYRDGVSTTAKTYPNLDMKEGRYEPLEYPDMFFEQRNWTGLYKKDFIESNGIKHNETKGASFQDVSFNFLCMSKARDFYFYPKAFLHYRVDNPGSSIHSRGKTFALCDEMFYTEGYLREHFWEDSDIYSMLANIRFRLYQRDAFHRIYLDDKYSFLQQAVREYKRDEELGRYKKDLWAADDWDELQRILSDDKRYLAELKQGFDEKIAQRTKFIDQVRTYPDVYVYGAGRVGAETIGNLKDYGIIPDKVLVENTDINPDMCCGIEVVSYKDDKLSKDSPVVLIALAESSLEQVEDRLKAAGYRSCIVMNRDIRGLFSDIYNK